MSDVAILAVDDTHENLIALDALLARPGLRVLTAASADAALDLLLRDEVALALIDVQMPVTGGFELAEIMRGSERTRRIPIIFLTAAISDPMRTFRGYETGAVDFLHKPFDPLMLKSKVDVFVELQLQRRQLALQLAAVEESLKANELFAAVLGHDLRNPLAAVMNYAYVLGTMKRGPEVEAIAASIRNSCQRMTRMINQLLDVARIRTGRFEIHPARGDLAALCRGIVTENEAGQASRVRVEATGDTHCEFDVDRMSQVVSNLVGNALRHGEALQPIVVAIDGSERDFVAVSVVNGGVVPDDVLEHFFEPFHGTPERQSASDGLGLGLHIVQRFVAAHGGSVDVHSDAANGTVVTLRIPRAHEPRGQGTNWSKR